MKLIYYIILLFGLAAVPEISKQRLAVREVAEKAAAGDPKALYDLAMLHDMGYDSIPVDSARSTLLYRLSAEAGYAPAQNYIGFRYFNGEAVKENVDSALYWLAKAAGNGDAKAANNLGFLLANSEKVTRDYTQAIYWLTKAADAGLPAGMSQLADLYRLGQGCTPDTTLAESLYTRAIQAGLHDAEIKLLNMKGRQWETLSPDSLLTLGRYHYTHGAPIIGVTLFRDIIDSTKKMDNHGMSENCDKSGTCENKINQGDTKSGGNQEAYDAVTTAMALMGDAYSRGQGLAYDHDSSVELYWEAAKRGNPSAAFVIAELLDIFPDALDTLIVSRDTNLDQPVTNAAYWYERAAAQGITDAATATARLLGFNDPSGY